MDQVGYKRQLQFGFCFKEKGDAAWAEGQTTPSEQKSRQGPSPLSNANANTNANANGNPTHNPNLISNIPIPNNTN